MKKAKISKSQDLMFALCDSPDKNFLCRNPKNSSLRVDCTIECFNENNPKIAYALDHPNSDEARHYVEKIQACAMAVGVKPDLKPKRHDENLTFKKPESKKP